MCWEWSLLIDHFLTILWYTGYCKTHIHVGWLQVRLTIAWMAYLCSGRTQENLASCELWSLTWIWWTTIDGKGTPAEGGELFVQELGSCSRKLGFHPLVTTWWAFLVVIIEWRYCRAHGKGGMACGCSGTQWLVTDAKEGIQARGKTWQKRLPFIHSKILILLSSARLWEVLGITVIKEDGGLGRSWWEKASLKTWLLYRQEHPF